MTTSMLRPTTSMLRPTMVGKIHRATVTRADLNDVGSITIDSALLEAADGHAPAAR